MADEIVVDGKHYTSGARIALLCGARTEDAIRNRWHRRNTGKKILYKYRDDVQARNYFDDNVRDEAIAYYASVDAKKERRISTGELDTFPLLTAVAAIMGLNTETLRRWIDRNRPQNLLPGAKHGKGREYHVTRDFADYLIDGYKTGKIVIRTRHKRENDDSTSSGLFSSDISYCDDGDEPDAVPASDQPEPNPATTMTKAEIVDLVRSVAREEFPTDEHIASVAIDAIKGRFNAN